MNMTNQTATPTPAKMKRSDYKAIKHMCKSELETYITGIYLRGYNAGVQSITGETATDWPPPPPEEYANDLKGAAV